MDCKEVIQQVFSRSLSGLKEDPALSQRVIELGKNRKGKQTPLCKLRTIIRKENKRKTIQHKETVKQNMQSSDDFDLSVALPPMPNDVHQALMETANALSETKK